MNSPNPLLNPRRLAGRLTTVATTGLLVGAAVFGVGAAASAGAAVDDTAPVEAAEVTHDEGEYAEEYEMSAEEVALFDDYLSCLTDNGVPHLDGGIEENEELTDAQLDEIDAVIEEADEVCFPIIEEYVEELEAEYAEEGDIHFEEGDFEEGDFEDFEDFELSAEDEAVFDEHDKCLTDNGVPNFDGLDENTEITDEQLEAFETAYVEAAETCDPILDNLSEDYFADFGLSAEDEAVFDEYDKCLTDNGVPNFDDLEDGDLEDTEITDEQWEAFETAYVKAAETCDPILDNLSEDYSADFDEEYDEEELEAVES